jgi:hypothetical protein
MFNRFLKAIAGGALVVVGLAIVVLAIKSNHSGNVTVSNSMDACSETMLVFGMIVGLYGAYLIYAGWNPEEAAKLAQEQTPTVDPSANQATTPPPLPPDGGKSS